MIRELYKGDFVITSLKELESSSIRSKRHFDCSLAVQTGSNGEVAVLHNPASDTGGETANSMFKNSPKRVLTSCIIYRGNNNRSQLEQIRRAENKAGIKIKKRFEFDVSTLVTPGEPYDLLVDSTGIGIEHNGTKFLLVSTLLKR